VKQREAFRHKVTAAHTYKRYLLTGNRYPCSRTFSSRPSNSASSRSSCSGQRRPLQSATFLSVPAAAGVLRRLSSNPWSTLRFWCSTPAVALWGVNTAHPLYPELRQIAIKTFGIREPIEEVLASLTGTVERAFIFGSIAKGTDRPDSDVDVMVVGAVRLGQAARAMDGVSHRLGREVHLNVTCPLSGMLCVSQTRSFGLLLTDPELNWISVRGQV
jgi:predicted nucleotidyltransferase